MRVRLHRQVSLILFYNPSAVDFDSISNSLCSLAGVRVHQEQGRGGLEPGRYIPNKRRFHGDISHPNRVRPREGGRCNDPNPSVPHILRHPLPPRRHPGWVLPRRDQGLGGPDVGARGKSARIAMRRARIVRSGCIDGSTDTSVHRFSAVNFDALSNAINVTSHATRFAHHSAPSPTPRRRA